MAFAGALWWFGVVFKLTDLYAPMKSATRGVVLGVCLAIFLGFIALLGRAMRRGVED